MLYFLDDLIGFFSLFVEVLQFNSKLIDLKFQLFIFDEQLLIFEVILFDVSLRKDMADRSIGGSIVIFLPTIILWYGKSIRFLIFFHIFKRSLSSMCDVL